MTAWDYYHGEEISSAIARQHGIRKKPDDGGIGKTLAAFVRRADKGALSLLMVEASILLAASRSNPTTDTEAIAAKVKQEFAAKDRAKKTAPRAAKTSKKTQSQKTH